MNDTVPLEVRSGDYSGDELRVILGNLSGTDPEKVCETAAVVVWHTPGGGHSIRMLTDTDEGPERLALLFEHAARHARGRCDACAAKRRAPGRRRD